MVCPKQGKGAALILPTCNTEAMNLHLAEIAATVAPAAHPILLVDQAGWHMSTRLIVPANITIIHCRQNAPSSIRSENVWQFLRDNWLSTTSKLERMLSSISVTDNAHSNLTLRPRGLSRVKPLAVVARFEARCERLIVQYESERESACRITGKGRSRSSPHGLA